MYIRVSLLLFLLENVAPSDANLFTRGSDTILRTASRVRHNAVKRSTGLMRDLRTAYHGVLVDQTDSGSGGTYCINVLSNESTLNGGSGSGSSSGGISGGVGGSAVASGTSAAVPSASSSAEASSPWKLQQSYEGNTFFGGWAFFTYTDPTAGVVDYVNGDAAETSNLTGVNSAGNAYLKVETTPVVTGYRKSVRITTDFTYTKALVVLDAVHLPTGCGTWPAFWSNGPNWPDGGEIDIVEGVNDYTNDQVTLHTNTGCSLPTNNTAQLDITGTLVSGTDCSVSGTGDSGCGVRATQTDSFGAPFNAVGGGVYAMNWDDAGITVHFFNRSAIPADITTGAPQPTSWGTPIANFPSSSCNSTEFFYDHSAIFDTTLCGDWAGDGWNSTGAPGQEQSCAQRTGLATCEEFVANNGAAFEEAYWEIKSVKIYQTS
ncbi:glycoside hydrolase family 16 protein [Laetiporus sulphureus 93-53]|uniref:Glycoside hydrolase family 16 protein n=1 Tax=Laetiporus sulphureus 93-53 TaxID=1314785 RepID=A0A165E4A7_9APHY|nr:glycoside hydrolase family 16 protein [Laetiporus sulphureus 93-53]KZT06218.1 glycoside hydrolase family 16 protein [Laetiporus sulphureus 93-53]